MHHTSQATLQCSDLTCVIILGRLKMDFSGETKTRFNTFWETLWQAFEERGSHSGAPADGDGSGRRDSNFFFIISWLFLFFGSMFSDLFFGLWLTLFELRSAFVCSDLPSFDSICSDLTLFGSVILRSANYLLDLWQETWFWRSRWTVIWNSLPRVRNKVFWRTNPDLISCLG